MQTYRTRSLSVRTAAVTQSWFPRFIRKLSGNAITVTHRRQSRGQQIEHDMFFLSFPLLPCRATEYSCAGQLNQDCLVP